MYKLISAIIALFTVSLLFISCVNVEKKNDLNKIKSEKNIEWYNNKQLKKQKLEDFIKRVNETEGCEVMFHKDRPLLDNDIELVRVRLNENYNLTDLDVALIASSVMLSELKLSNCPLTKKQYKILSQTNKFEYFMKFSMIGGNLDNEMLGYISSLNGIEVIRFNNVKVSNGSYAILSQLPKLRFAAFTKTNLKDDDLMAFKDLKTSEYF